MGPDLLEPLFSVLLCFRTEKYAFIADLKECFFQVAIPAEQQEFVEFYGLETITWIPESTFINLECMYLE